MSTQESTLEVQTNGRHNGRFDISLKTLLVDLKRQFDILVKNRDRLAATESWLETIKNEDVNEPPSEKILDDFRKLCVRLDLQALLASYDITHPSYNYFKSFDDNKDKPWDAFPRNWFEVDQPTYEVLGQKGLDFPIGVPASVLTSTVGWIEYYARHGFNILTFKTVRSAAKDAHPEPNWVFLNELNKPLAVGKKLKSCIGTPSSWPSDPKAFSMANSFGVPSFEPKVWQAEVKESLTRLRKNQLLIVSVIGNEKYKGDKFLEDFAKVARMAKETGTKAIELNLSCPNTVDPDTGTIKTDLLCESPEDTFKVVTAVRDKIGNETRLVIKLSYMDSIKLKKVLEPLFTENGKLRDTPLIHGVSGINTLAMEVFDKYKQPTFTGNEEHRHMARNPAGISGIAIRDYGLDFVSSLAEIREDKKWVFDIIGMGGVMTSDDVFAYRKAGATAVQAATAAFYNATLPREISQRLEQTSKPATAPR